MWGDVLENLKVSDVRVSPGLAQLRGRAGSSNHIMLSAGAPSNQQILDATKAFYASSQKLVDATTVNTNNVASSQRGFVSQLNSNNWQNNQLTRDEQTQTSTSLFGQGDGGGGLFGPTLDNVKATNLFTTIGIGVSAEAMVVIGGLGGIGCAFDIAKREGPKGYGYATLELGLKVAADINVQASIFNQLPSALDSQIYGLTVSIYYGLGATFTTFFTGMSTAELLGYSISIGIGAGAGASVFGGHVWNFG